MSYICPECGGTGKKGRRKCKLCKGKKSVNENELRKRSGKMSKAVYRSTLGEGYTKVEDNRRRRR